MHELHDNQSQFGVKCRMISVRRRVEMTDRAFFTFTHQNGTDEWALDSDINVLILIELQLQETFKHFAILEL